MKTFANEIRLRLPRILTSLATMLALIFVLYLIMPVTYVTSYVLPGAGIAGGVIVGVAALILALIIELRIYGDLEALTAAFASYAVAHRKRLAARRREELRSSLADMGKVVSLLILIALIAPVLVIIPGIGVAVVVLPIIGILVAVLYGWRSWEITKDELEKIFKNFADSLAKSFEK
jgi:small-conductance mechanosensitive channel